MVETVLKGAPIYLCLHRGIRVTWGSSSTPNLKSSSKSIRLKVSVLKVSPTRYPCQIQSVCFPIEVIDVLMQTVSTQFPKTQAVQSTLSGTVRQEFQGMMDGGDLLVLIIGGQRC